MITLKSIISEISSKYINERLYLHRWMNKEELKFLLEKKYYNSKKKFVSLTIEPEKAASAGFSGILVTFDRNNIERLNPKIQEVFYEEDFFDKFPDICLYVTGYKNKKDYDGDELDWEQFLTTFEDENEVVIPNKIKIDKNSIVLLSAKSNYKDILKNCKNIYNIEYELI